MGKKNLVSRVLNERILLGGEEMTRAEAYLSMRLDGISDECADYFAFHSGAINESLSGSIDKALDNPDGK